jgi:hypothetical protein
VADGWAGDGEGSISDRDSESQMTLNNIRA